MPTTAHADAPVHLRSRRRRLANSYGEPVGLITALQMLLVVLAVHQKLAFIGINSKADVALLIVVINALAALYAAFMTDQPVLAPLVEAVKAVANLAVLYGLHLSTEDLGMIIAGITAVVGGFHRNSVSWLGKADLTLAA